MRGDTRLKALEKLAENLPRADASRLPFLSDDELLELIIADLSTDELRAIVAQRGDEIRAILAEREQ